jgi:hypothetical protein
MKLNDTLLDTHLTLHTVYYYHSSPAPQLNQLCSLPKVSACRFPEHPN